ncbi:multidrug transporter EmrE-like cation transporter [Geomicrobium halophilum]|uniref:Multidrug transporter EmrE-like cation transporter n=1 Tax=Geomicrobium halophilum TaxID=549000 RepID=A0A841PZ55_9BACL|nr:hypothetical protein [Geomicrobium halophilum]MBB6449635.1 multidrug transporter EmrE-like cation transporter [Geomicrobium halophilum]
MNRYTKRLMVLAAIFGILGVVMGGHMAGAGSPALRPVHAHALVVGWLSLFAWGVYYQLFNVSKRLANWQTWTGMIGTIFLVLGMWVHLAGALEALPFGVTLAIYIGGGTILIASYILFLIVVLKQKVTD